MICKCCFEVEAIDGETLCQDCKDATYDTDITPIDELINKIGESDV